MGSSSTKTHSIMHCDSYTIIPNHTLIYLIYIFIFMYQLQLLTSFHHECNCQPTSSINQSDLIDGLLKHNSKLTKYLSKYTNQPYQPPSEPNPPTPQPPAKPSNLSIIEEKGLNFGIPDDNKRINKQQPQPQPQHQPQTNEQEQQTQPLPTKKTYKKPQPKTSFAKHYKQMSESSRYLSDTGFRKYFGRQCFENYGRNNTTGVADGIVYGNYMKTHNINPHSGYNMPIDGQTFDNALNHAQPNKYKPYEGVGRKQQHEGKPIYKQNYQMDKIREEAIKNEKDRLKYSRMKLVSKEKEDTSPIKQIKQVRNIQHKQIQPSIKQNTQTHTQQQIYNHKIQQPQIIKQPQPIKQQQISKHQQQQATKQQKYYQREPSPKQQIKSSLIEYNPPLVYLQEQQCICRCSKHITECPRCRRSFKEKIIEKGFDRVGVVNRILQTRCRR